MDFRGMAMVEDHLVKDGCHQKMRLVFILTIDKNAL